jgi:type IV pilus assembly protein PilV
MRSEAGFTLLELLIAMTILAVGLLATLNMQTTAMQANGFAQRTSSATAVARAAMDELISRPSSDAIFQTAQAAAAFDLDQQTAALTQTVQGIVFSASITVTPNATVDAVAITGLTQVALTVTGSDRTVTMTGFKKVEGAI